MLAREKRFVSHGELAAKCGVAKKATRDWWQRMKGTDVRVASREAGAGPDRVDLFKNGRECFYAGMA